MFTLKRKTSFTILAAVCALFSISGSAQTALPGSKLTPAVSKRPVPENWHLNRNFVDGEGDTSERSISVVDNVNFSMCVMQGTVKVNGWKRSEVRVFVKNGSRIGIKVLEKDAKSQNP